VFKYGRGRLLLTLGEPFVNGRDEKHFCKPTDVAVSNDRSSVFVADGYCNARVVKLDAQGNYVGQYEMGRDETPLSIPHSLVLIESLDLVCVADRENGR
jgi:DNA-binding beta-propeller fold protein YncE